MKSFLKKAMPFLFVFSSLAVAASLITNEEVNAKVAALVAPYNDKNTVMAIQFTALNVDSVRALDFGLNAMIAKKGSENKLVLKLQNVSYHYGDGSSPIMTGDLSFQTNLVKAFGQENLNDLSQDLEKLVKNAATDIGKKYGEAAKINVAVEDLNRDTQGNFESAKLHLYVTIDLNNLPADLKVEDVEFKSLKTRLVLNGKGVRAKVQVVLNPLYSRFEADQPGLKEYIEKLLSEDSETYKNISDAADWLNGIATDLVNRNAQ